MAGRGDDRGNDAGDAGGGEIDFVARHLGRCFGDVWLRQLFHKTPRNTCTLYIYFV